MQTFLDNTKSSKAFERLLATIMIVAALTLIVLIYYDVRPVPLLDIKVPVATDKSSYYPGQNVSGIFFGEVFYDGKVEILRQIYCKDYVGTIKTSDGDDIFKGVSRWFWLRTSSNF